MTLTDAHRLQNDIRRRYNENRAGERTYFHAALPVITQYLRRETKPSIEVRLTEKSDYVVLPYMRIAEGVPESIKPDTTPVDVPVISQWEGRDIGYRVAINAENLRRNEAMTLNLLFQGEFAHTVGENLSAYRKHFVHVKFGLPNEKAGARRFEAVKYQMEKGLMPEGAAAYHGFFDIDGMKELNDQGGHDHGDAAIKRMFDTLLMAQSEIPELKYSCISHIGGDEGSMIIPSATSAAMEQLADRVRKTFETIHYPRREEYTKLGRSPTITPGVSFAFVPILPGDTFETALKRADDAMYADKRYRKADRESRERRHE